MDDGDVGESGVLMTDWPIFTPHVLFMSLLDLPPSHYDMTCGIGKSPASSTIFHLRSQVQSSHEGRALSGSSTVPTSCVCSYQEPMTVPERAREQRTAFVSHQRHHVM